VGRAYQYLRKKAIEGREPGIVLGGLQDTFVSRVAVRWAGVPCGVSH
jgi:hypothetical protein